MGRARTLSRGANRPPPHSAMSPFICQMCIASIGSMEHAHALCKGTNRPLNEGPSYPTMPLFLSQICKHNGLRHIGSYPQMIVLYNAHALCEGTNRPVISRHISICLGTWLININGVCCVFWIILIKLSFLTTCKHVWTCCHWYYWPDWRSHKAEKYQEDWNRLFGPKQKVKVVFGLLNSVA